MVLVSNLLVNVGPSWDMGVGVCIGDPLEKGKEEWKKKRKENKEKENKKEEENRKKKEEMVKTEREVAKVRIFVTLHLYLSPSYKVF